MTEIETRVSNAVKDAPHNYSELARRAGVERSAVGKWAKTGKISIESLVSLCRVLNLDLIYMLLGKEDYTSQQRKAIELIKQQPKEHSVKLELVIKLLTE